MSEMHHPSYLPLLIFCLCACTAEQQPEQTQAYIALEVQQDPLRDDVRSSDDATVSSAFQDGDSLGLFNYDQTLSKWTYTDTWQTENRPVWKDRQTETTFYAFAPYVNKALPTEVPLPDLTQQGGKLSEIRLYDFLWGSITTNYTAREGLISFTGRNNLKHLYALLTFEFKTNSPDIPVILHTLKLDGNHLFTKRNYNLLTRQTTDESTEISSHTFRSDQRIPPEGCLLACIINPTDKPLTLTVNFERDGRLYTASTHRFAPIHGGGTWSKYTLLIQQQELIVSGNDISNWQVHHWDKEIPITEELPDSIAP